MPKKHEMFWSLAIFLLPSLVTAALSPTYYSKTCPQALPIISQTVKAAVRKESRMGASILRLHFHDCFVQGCDASLLLDKTATIDSEKFSVANDKSVRGFEVIDQIKSAVDKACPGPVVSCADILTVAARDSVVALGGPSWTVPLGRRDSTTASRTLADSNLPAPFGNLSDLIQSFAKQGLGVTDMVTLVGGHTLGFSRCVSFRQRIYSNETNLDPAYAKSLRSKCPQKGGDNNLEGLDFTNNRFDSNYFNKLVVKKGLLHSDQQLFSGGSTDNIVRKYSNSYAAFASAFAQSMVKMGNIKPLTGTAGQVRKNCRAVN